MTDDVGTPDTINAPIDLSDSTANEIGQIDTVSSLTDAGFYGYSIRGDFTKVAAAQANASYLQNAPGSELFILPNNGPIENLPGGEKKTEEEKALDAMRENAELLQEELKRQRDEWARTESTFAGITMTGAEWSELSDDLKQDSPLRRWLIEKMKRDGKTTAQAEGMADKLSELTHIQSIPKEQRTVEQQLMLDQGNRDKETNDYLRTVTERYKPTSAIHAVSADNISKAETSVSTEVGADEMVSFASAPDLTASYKIALAAKSLPDAEPKIAALEKPISPTVQASGFDV